MGRAMEVFPVYSDSGDGQPELQDFEIQHAHSGGEVEQEFTFDQYGNAQFEFDEEAYDSEDGESVTDEYADSVLDAFPDLPNALAWAAATLDADTVQGFNEAVDSGDPDEYMPLLEALMEDFMESDEFEPQETETDSDEIEVSDEEVNAVVEEMQESEPMGQEFALPYLEAAVNSQGTNPLYSDWCAATARFHSGEIDWEDAMDEMTSKYSMSDLAKMYHYMNNA